MQARNKILKNPVDDEDDIDDNDNKMLLTVSLLTVKKLL